MVTSLKIILENEAKDFGFHFFHFHYFSLSLSVLEEDGWTMRKDFKKRPICYSWSPTWTTVDPTLPHTLLNRNVRLAGVRWRELLSNNGGSPAYSTKITWRRDVEAADPEVGIGTAILKSSPVLPICRTCSLSFQPFLPSWIMDKGNPMRNQCQRPD